MTNAQKSVHITIKNNHNSCLHIDNSAPMEKNINISKSSQNHNFSDFQSVPTTSSSGKFSKSLIELNDSITDKTLSDLPDEIYSYENEYYDEVYNNLILDENYFYQKINPNYISFQKEINYKMRAILP